jgi:hypothetical protein
MVAAQHAVLVLLENSFHPHVVVTPILFVQHVLFVDPTKSPSHPVLELAMLMPLFAEMEPVNFLHFVLLDNVTEQIKSAHDVKLDTLLIMEILLITMLVLFVHPVVVLVSS